MRFKIIEPKLFHTYVMLEKEYYIVYKIFTDFYKHHDFNKGPFYNDMHKLRWFNKIDINKNIRRL